MHRFTGTARNLSPQASVNPRTTHVTESEHCLGRPGRPGRGSPGRDGLLAGQRGDRPGPRLAPRTRPERTSRGRPAPVPPGREVPQKMNVIIFYYIKSPASEDD
jgi:hypothetical protein